MKKPKRLKLRVEIGNKIVQGMQYSIDNGGSVADGIIAGVDQIVLFIQNNYRRRQK